MDSAFGTFHSDKQPENHCTGFYRLVEGGRTDTAAVEITHDSIIASAVHSVIELYMHD